MPSDFDKPRRYRNYTRSIRAQLPDYISDDVVAEINRHAEKQGNYNYRVGWSDARDCGVAVFDHLDEKGRSTSYALVFDKAKCSLEDHPDNTYAEMLREDLADRRRINREKLSRWRKEQRTKQYQRQKEKRDASKRRKPPVQDDYRGYC